MYASLETSADHAALARMREYLLHAELQDGGRLPPERDLALSLGLSRGALRKALADLEAEGVLWRHVGKGTFTGARPIDSAADVAAMASRTNPIEIMGARLSIEPEIARVAALNATPASLARMRQCTERMLTAVDWRQYESWDNQFHRTVAEATQNTLLVGLLDTLNAVRRQVNWGRLRANPKKPPSDHHSFAEHEAIMAAIHDRDTQGASNAMRVHLQSVERNLRNA